MDIIDYIMSEPKPIKKFVVVESMFDGNFKISIVDNDSFLVLRTKTHMQRVLEILKKLNNNFKNLIIDIPFYDMGFFDERFQEMELRYDCEMPPKDQIKYMCKYRLTLIGFYIEQGQLKENKDMEKYLEEDFK